MKYLKTYEGKHTKYKIGNYIVWNDEDIWEICEIISKTNLNTIRVLDKFYLKDYNLNTHTSEFNTPSNIDLIGVCTCYTLILAMNLIYSHLNIFL